MFDQLVGSPSIIFKRLAIKNETLIKNHLYSNPKICKSVKGFDANALYLRAIMQNMPTGFFVRYREIDQYRPETPHKFGLASHQWLSWVAATEEKFIQHSFNIGERHLTSKKLLVDGFCQETNEMFEFFGCFFHGCFLYNPGGEINPLNGKSFQELRQKTEEKKKLLEESGFCVRIIWECDWKRLSSNREIVSFIQSLKAV